MNIAFLFFYLWCFCWFSPENTDHLSPEGVKKRRNIKSVIFIELIVDFHLLIDHFNDLSSHLSPLNYLRIICENWWDLQCHLVEQWVVINVELLFVLKVFKLVSFFGEKFEVFEGGILIFCHWLWLYIDLFGFKRALFTSITDNYQHITTQN